MSYHYHCNPLGAKAKEIIFADEELKETYETIKVLSDDFTIKDNTAVELDEMLKDVVLSIIDNETPPKPKATPKPKAELPLPKEKKTKEQVIKELLEQLEENQQSPVSAEQVKTIVENV